VSIQPSEILENGLSSSSNNINRIVASISFIHSCSHLWLYYLFTKSDQ
jgi:hypothetical protein